MEPSSEFLAADPNFPGCGGVEAENGGGDFAAAGADEAGEAEDFARAQSEADVGEFAGAGKFFDAKNLGAEFAIEMGGARVDDFASDHLLDDALGIRGGDGFGGDVFAVAQDGNGVAQAEDFFHAMGDVDDGDAAGFEFFEEREKMFAFADGERTGRLVHDDDFRADTESGGDLGHLFLAGGEVLHGGIDVERGFDFFEHAAGALAHGGVIDATKEAREFAEAKIFGDGEVRAEGEFLMNHGDAKPAGGERIGGMNDLAVEKDFAGISGVNAGEDFAEGAFAGAVLADQRVAMAALDGERDVVEGEDAGEAFGDVLNSRKGIVQF
jgi:hypothetical protein